METQRYPISVGLIGVMQKEKDKMYMASVLWSDQNEIVVYRTLKDFGKMHKQIKKAFPSSKKSDRIIPKFNDKKVKSQKKRGSTRSLQRLKFLQKYCNKLLSCDPRVSQSAELIQFLHPKEQDLHPDFAKNSIMIMPPDSEMGNAAHGSPGGNVTQPFVTETYRCVATYETKDTKNKPFKVALDEKVDVLIKDKGGWWLVENEDKRMAWFPAPYLEKLEDDDDDDDIDGASDRGMLYIAVKTYKATKDDEITVAIGAVVEVLQKSDNGWWLIRYGGKAGYIPTMYLQPYNNPHIRMPVHSRTTSPIPLSPQLLHSNQLSLSYGNLLHPQPIRSSTPSQLQTYRKPRSRSIGLAADQLPVPPPGRADTSVSAPTSPTTKMLASPPTIMVGIYGEERMRAVSPSAHSEGSTFSDSSDFSDDLNSSWASNSSFNLSYNEELMRLSRTPPPTQMKQLSPTSAQGKMIPSTSDPNLYKGPAAPKVPPRPHAQEILTRCSSITRKNASRGRLSPTQAEVMSR